MEANLVMQMKNKAPRMIPVPNEVTVIGRQRNCDFRIPLESVSRRHCQVHCDNEGVILRDLGSRNGTLLNGMRMSHEEQVLRPGDRIEIGPIAFVLQVDGQPDSDSLRAQQPAAQESPLDVNPVTEDDALGGDEFADGLGDSGDLDILDLDELGDLDDLDDLDLDDI